ncbi:MAG: N-acetylmuramoyl-L-alanine amidase [Spirochaetales bacterium]|nr:N-acetylmuramoyl-L-alanine amidase [Spirochaetales bacterium]
MFLLISSALFGEDGDESSPPVLVDISELAGETGAVLRFDYWKGIYELRKGSRSVRFTAGTSWYLLNYTELRPELVSELTKDGHFLIDYETAAVIKEFFVKASPGSYGIKYIVLDPGHGGKDPGAIGYYLDDNNEKKALNEKDVVLETAMETAALLEARYPDKEVILTRSDDRYLKLEERTGIANSVELAENESMIFVSIHANASFNSKARGFEVWYLPPEYRRDLIDPESFKDIDSDVLPILNTMLEEEYTIESVILGEKLLVSLDGQVGNLTENRGPKEESWFVVRNAKMPSVLIELGFVTNNDEAVLLASHAYLKKLSKGIYNGVVDFINDYEHTRGYIK